MAQNQDLFNKRNHKNMFGEESIEVVLQDDTMYSVYAHDIVFPNEGFPQNKIDCSYCSAVHQISGCVFMYHYHYHYDINKEQVTTICYVCWFHSPL